MRQQTSSAHEHVQQHIHPIADSKYTHPIADPNAFFCINCGRKLLDKLIGQTFYLKIKCARCKARFVINKEHNAEHL